MANFCIPRNIVEKLRESARSGELPLKDLQSMTSAQRRAAFEKIAGQDLAVKINGHLEEAMISRQKGALKSWANSVFVGKEARTGRHRTVLEKIDQLDKLGVLDPKSSDSFLSDLASVKMGVGVSAEEARHIGETFKKVQQMPEGYERWKELDRLGEYVMDRLPKEKTNFVSNVGNLMRSMSASVDLSAPLRQGWFFMSRPKQFFPAFRRMFSVLGKDGYDLLRYDIEQNPHFKTARENGLMLADVNSSLSTREERFASTWAEKIPLFGGLVKGSERAYTGFLNKLRMDTFSDLYSKAESMGLKPEKNPKFMKDLAEFVNCGTGRGDLGKLNDAAVALNGMFFSPRLMASRLKLLNPVYYVKADPFVRKEALKSLILSSGVAATVIGLAKLAGADVEDDMRNPDWGKIKVGNTRVDMLGGFQQYLRIGAQLVTGKKISSTTGRVTLIGKGYNAPTRWDILIRGLETKEAPLMAFITTLLKGDEGFGKVDLKSELAKKFIPMSIQDLVEIAKDDPRHIPLFIPGIFGAGSQTYPPYNQNDIRAKLRYMIREKDPNVDAEIRRAVQSKELKAVDVARIRREAQSSELELQIRQTSLDNALEIYGMQNEADRKEMLPIIRQKIVRAYRTRPSNLSVILKKVKSDYPELLPGRSET